MTTIILYRHEFLSEPDIAGLKPFDSLLEQLDFHTPHELVEVELTVTKATASWISKEKHVLNSP